ncbi:MAG: membrane protein insertion efficiency factor YidD [Bacteroidales bacterium]|nr:membrane protein insertion efficiency factor YidD [Bacteroidales bacterium]
MKKCIIIILALGSISFGYSQTFNELELLQDQHEKQSEHVSPFKRLKESQGVLSNLFSLYKILVSSQDYHSCVFTPSCSEYAIQSIKKQGLINGIMDSLDRLTRCNGLRPAEYKIDKQNGLLIDPVRNAQYEEL